MESWVGTKNLVKFCSHFSLPVQLSTATDIIEYMAQLPDDKETGINKETS
jgi:hypothetical protein